MKENNLFFNVLTFSHAKEELTFHFTDQAHEGLTRFYNTQVPGEVIEHFGIKEHFYTSFEKPEDGFFAVTKRSEILREQLNNEEGEEIVEPIKNSAFSLAILKAYYNTQIFNFFKVKGFLVKPNHIKSTEVWLPCKSQPANSPYKFFEKYALKVQFRNVSQNPELLVTFEGKARIFKKPLTDFVDYSPEIFNWVVYNRALFKYDKLPDEGRRNLDAVYPVWNFDIRTALMQKPEAPERGNKYEKFWKNINRFFLEHIATHEFNNIIPINAEGFIKVSEKRIGNVNHSSNRLLFGNQQSHIVPFEGLTQYGPFDLSPARNIMFFFIYHEKDVEVAKTIDAFFRGKKRGFKGLAEFIKTPYNTVPGSRIVFQNLEDPWSEIYPEILNRTFSSDVQHFAIYISPFAKDETDLQQKSVYYKLKEELLKKDVLSQVIDGEKVPNNNSYHFFLPNIATAILAKLNGTPWKLDTKLKKELVVGVGAFKSTQAGVHYIASAFSFSNNGKFNRFECFMKNQTRELAGSIIRAVKDFVNVNNEISRLIIHFYKEMSKEEIKPIEKGLESLDLDIPVFIVSINKTESKDIVAFDQSWNGLMPKSGTFINIGFNKFLLFNNIRYSNGFYRDIDGYPFPVKLMIKCSDPELVKTHTTVKDLIDQVYQFSRMYWKSVRQQNLPVTIKYPEIVAEMFPYFNGDEIPDFGKDKLWFL